MLVRKLLKSKYKNDYKAIPLSFVLNNLLDSVPIGMLNKKSIERNILIEKEKFDYKINKNIGDWCLNNIQINNNIVENFLTRK